MFTSGMERRPPESYADLKHRNYTLYVLTKTDDFGSESYEYLFGSLIHRHVAFNLLIYIFHFK